MSVESSDGRRMGEEEELDSSSHSGGSEEDLILTEKRNRTNYNSIYPFMDVDPQDFEYESSSSDDSDSNSNHYNEYDSTDSTDFASGDRLKPRKIIRILSHGWIPRNFNDDYNPPPTAWLRVVYDNGDEAREFLALAIAQSARVSKMVEFYAHTEAIQDAAFQAQVQWLLSLRHPTKVRNTSKGTTANASQRRSKSTHNRSKSVGTVPKRTIPKHTNKSVTIPGCNVELVNYVREIRRSADKEKKCFLDAILDRRHLKETRKVKELGTMSFKQKYDGHDVDLLSIKIQSDPNNQNSFRGKFAMNEKEAAISYFVRSDDGINIKDELEKIANWSALPSTTKLAARFSLLQSPLAFNKYGDLQYCVHDSVFEDIEEGRHTGCGFIDPMFLQDILGPARGSRTNSIQVRLFIPRKGIYKGMLMKKVMDPGSPVKVQLPESMKKVSASKCPRSEYGSICICKAGIDPSEPCIILGDLYSRNFKKKTLENGKLNIRMDGKQEGEGMITRLLKHHGASVTTMKQYHDNNREFVKRYDSIPVDERDSKLPSIPIRHSYLRGVADPTGHIPSDMVFIPGLQKDDSILKDVDTIFITRSPSLMPEDVKLVKLMKTKPESMSQVDYEFLNRLKFGIIIFGFSDEGTLPIPECISGGDLDGDRYFCCWSKDILSELTNIDSLMYVPVQSSSESSTSESEPIENEHWFTDLQSYLMNSQELQDKQELIGLLYNASLKAAKESQKFLDDEDATAYAKAYIDAINTAKHDTPIRLPKRLWNNFLPKGKSVDKYLKLLTDY